MTGQGGTQASYVRQSEEARLTLERKRRSLRSPGFCSRKIPSRSEASGSYSAQTGWHRKHCHFPPAMHMAYYRLALRPCVVSSHVKRFLTVVRGCKSTETQLRQVECHGIDLLGRHKWELQSSSALQLPTCVSTDPCRVSSAM